MKSLNAESIDMLMTSPPYWGLRDYGVEGQLGLEPDPLQYIERMANIFDEVKRVLKPTGSAYVNLGDTYCCPGKWGGETRQSITGTRDRNYPEGVRPQGISMPAASWVRRKQLALIPSRFAIAMQDRGWILRNDIIWHKTNGLPASVKDRLSNRYEHVFHFVKGEKYYYNLEVIREQYKESSFKRFGGLVAQNFTRKQSKYNLLSLPEHAQFREGRIPVPTWLEKTSGPSAVTPEGTMKKAQQLYLLSKGKIGHGHYSAGAYVGIRSSPFGKNPGDVIELPAVRHKPWMSTPGHPFTHKATSKPQNPGDFWPISSSSYRGAHFAVYPEKLCVKPILSSCPPWVCTKCGAPKREIVSAGVQAAFNIRVRDAKKGILSQKWGNRFNASDTEIQNYKELFYEAGNRTRVIAEGCSCEAGFQPGVVLDPFVGSGTTMKVAADLGRSCIGVDINSEYVALIKQRAPKLRDEDIVYIDSVQRQGRHVPRQTYLKRTAETISGIVK